MTFSTFKKVFFVDCDTAFQVTHKAPGAMNNTALLYTVRKTPGVPHWQVFGVNNNRERCVCTYWGGSLDMFEMSDKPANICWWYRHWVLIHTITSDQRLTGYTVTELAYCKRCGRLLTNPDHIARGYGTQCYIATLEEQR